MSIETSTLSDFTATRSPEEQREQRIAEYREIILEEGRVYNRTTSQKHEDTPEQECLCCARSIPSSIARVLGDNNGNVPACDRCWTSPGGTDFDGIGRAVRQYRAGDGMRKMEYGGETHE